MTQVAKPANVSFMKLFYTLLIVLSFLGVKQSYESITSICDSTTIQEQLSRKINTRENLFPRLINSNLVCFINSIMQCLYSIESFRKFILTDITADSPKYIFKYTLKTIFKKMYANRSGDLNLLPEYMTIAYASNLHLLNKTIVIGEVGEVSIVLINIVNGILNEEKERRRFYIDYLHTRISFIPSSNSICHWFRFHGNHTAAFSFYIFPPLTEVYKIKHYANTLTTEYKKENIDENNLPYIIPIEFQVADKDKAIISDAILHEQIKICGVNYTLVAYTRILLGAVNHYTTVVLKNRMYYLLDDNKYYELHMNNVHIYDANVHEAFYVRSDILNT